MTNQELERRTSEVRDQLAAAAGPSRGRGRGYGAPARSMAVGHARELMATGQSVRQAAVSIGVHEATLKIWLTEANARPESVFARVRVKRDAATSSRALSLILPSGARVDGLDIASAAALVRALG